MEHLHEDNQTALQEAEFNRRCHVVFPRYDPDGYKVWLYAIHIDSDSRVCVYLWFIVRDIDDDGTRVVYRKYCPNMERRPHALAYLLGKRDDYNFED